MRARTPLAHSAESIASAIRENLPEFYFSVHHNWFSRPSLVGMIVDFIRASAVDGDVTHVTGDCGYLVLALRSRRTVLTVLDCGTYRRSSGVRRWLYGVLWIKWPARRAREVVAISETVRRDVLAIAGIPEERVKVVHCCIAQDFFVTAPPARRQVSAKPVLLQVGTTANKNIERLAEALEGFSGRLVIIGQLMPSQAQALRRYGVDFIARERLSRQEVIAAYLQCDAVIFASLFEGFGLPIIEGQACRRPVIASDLEVHHEIAGESVCYVDPCDARSIRAGIDRVLADVEFSRRLVELGLRNARRFTAAEMSRRYASVYREVLESERP
jgi:glycosyltransferase involved in cell wall biosynthesis